MLLGALPKKLCSTEPANAECTKANGLHDGRTAQSLKRVSVHGDVSKRRIQLGHVHATTESVSPTTLHRTNCAELQLGQAVTCFHFLPPWKVAMTVPILEMMTPFHEVSPIHCHIPSTEINMQQALDTQLH